MLPWSGSDSYALGLSHRRQGTNKGNNSGPIYITQRVNAICMWLGGKTKRGVSEGKQGRWQIRLGSQSAQQLESCTQGTRAFDTLSW